MLKALNVALRPVSDEPPLRGIISLSEPDSVEPAQKLGIRVSDATKFLIGKVDRLEVVFAVRLLDHAENELELLLGGFFLSGR